MLRGIDMRAARLLSLLTCTWLVLSSSAQASEIICPIMFNGHTGGYRARTQLTMVNPGAEVLSATVKAFKNDGTPAAVFRGNSNAVSETSLELNQNEVMIRETDGESSVIQDGWLLLSYQTAARPLATADVYLLKEGETCSPESVFRVPFVEAGTRLMSVAELTLDWSTGTHQILSASAFALVNPSDTKMARVTLMLLKYPAGSGQALTYPDAVIEIPPRQRVARFLTEWFPVLSGVLPPPLITISRPRGTISIVSDSPIACGAVDLDLTAARYSQGVASTIESAP
jgi:hypothetical protein